MPKVIRDHHNLRRNLNLNDKYISNDGGDEGIRITDAGLVGIGVAVPDTQLEIFGTSTHLKLSYDADKYATMAVASDGDLSIITNSDCTQDSITLDSGQYHNFMKNGTQYFQMSYMGGVASLHSGYYLSLIHISEPTRPY